MNKKMSYWVMPCFREKEPEAILNEVARNYNITVSDIRSSSRRAAIAEARHISIYLIYLNLNKNIKDVGGKWTLKNIGKYVGERDHSTVISSIKTVKNLAETDTWFQSRLNDIKQKLGI